MQRPIPSLRLARFGASGATSSDLLRMALLVALGAALSVRFEFGERLAAWTTLHEVYQFDELPGILLIAAAGLLWFARRRYREACAEIAKRERVEAQLAQTLEDNRRLARQTIALQETERRALARELHDELGQYLNAIKVDAVALQRAAGDAPPPQRQALAAIVDGTDHVYRVAGDMIRRLRPVGLDELGLASAIEHCIDGWRRRLPQVRFSLEIHGDLAGLDEATNLTLYRMAQEGLTNVYRHAAATRADLRIERVSGGKGDAVVFTLADDGVGAVPAANRHGLGLVGMRERVEALGGSFACHGGPGFRIEARLPVGGESAR
ncbi:MAG: histidine kinase [Burkholderiaceae bacterium]